MGGTDFCRPGRRLSCSPRCYCLPEGGLGLGKAGTTGQRRLLCPFQFKVTDPDSHIQLRCG